MISHNVKRNHCSIYTYEHFNTHTHTHKLCIVAVYIRKGRWNITVRNIGNSNKYINIITHTHMREQSNNVISLYTFGMTANDISWSHVVRTHQCSLRFAFNAVILFHSAMRQSYSTRLFPIFDCYEWEMSQQQQQQKVMRKREREKCEHLLNYLSLLFPVWKDNAVHQTE